MESTYQRLQIMCQKAGTNLNEVCRMANIDRSVIERWKRREPKTIRILRALEYVIIAKKKPSETITEAASETITEAASETITEAASETITEAASETITEAASETITEAASEAITEAADEVETSPEEWL